MYKENYKRVRFHIEFGPASLFERVLFKMKDVHKLYLDGVHFKSRTAERKIPDSIKQRLVQFNINEWKLVTASVRADKGKFVDSTWELILNDIRYWVTIGIGQYVRTIVIKDSSGIENCVRFGEFYDFVDAVNCQLMNEERQK